MNKQNKTFSYTGIGFLDLLGVAFIILKLCGVIKWSWFLVLAPIWIQLALIVIVSIIYAAVNASDEKKYKEWEKKRWNL